MKIEDMVRELGTVVGLDIVRITGAKPLLDAKKRVPDSGMNRSDGYHADSGKFWNPQSALAGAKSAIVVAECYQTSETGEESKPGNPVGKIANYTWRNYYKDVSVKLTKIAAALKKETGCRNFKTCCGGLAEKALAERAGVGWYGKNSIIQTEKFGSRVVLGEIVTSLALEPDSPLEKNCGGCKKCVEACPTGALSAPYVLDRKKCLQHLTNWYGIFPENVREIWGDRLYGCTTCQDACPNNKKAKPMERMPDYGYVGPTVPLLPILAMTERDYFIRFRGNQMGAGWINFRSIQRNAVIALGNMLDSETAEEILPVLKNPDSVVRAHAAWALGRFETFDAKSALREALRLEKEPSVKNEIERAIG